MPPVVTPIVLSPLRRLLRFWRELTPPSLLVGSFVVLILIGTLGLWLFPGLFVAGEPLGFLDALFTMTSAVCVTGLVVVDTATYFTRLGQVWILLFIQLGGLGLISISTLIIGALGRQLSLRSEMLVLASSEITRRRDVVDLAWAILRTMLVVEGLGALALWLLWLPQFGVVEAAWHAVFHSVSAFCNAGFSTFSSSLVDYTERPLVLLVVSALIIAGGIGFLSGEEALRWWREGGKRGPRRLSSHTFGALWVTAALLLGGWVLFALFEWNNTFKPMGAGHKLVNALFMSVTARTAGFNSIPYAEVTNSSAYLTILLMVVGGSPGSTAGGIKTTSLAILLALAWSRLKGRRYVELHQRTVPEGTVDRTVSLALLAFALMTAGLFLLSFTEARPQGIAAERQAFLPEFFEVVSAFCTVGLSMDQTPMLRASSKLVLIGLMFVGRVGLLSFFAAVTLRTRTTLRDFRPAQEDLIVG